MSVIKAGNDKFLPKKFDLPNFTYNGRVSAINTKLDGSTYPG